MDMRRTLLVVSDENQLPQRRLVPVDDWKVVPDLNLGGFVDDQRLNRSNSRNFTHGSVEHAAQS